MTKIAIYVTRYVNSITDYTEEELIRNQEGLCLLTYIDLPTLR